MSNLRTVEDVNRESARLWNEYLEYFRRANLTSNPHEVRRGRLSDSPKFTWVKKRKRKNTMEW